MELVVHLNSVKFIGDFLEMGVKMFVVGTNIFSCRQAISLDYQQLQVLKEKTKGKAKIYVLVNALIEERDLDSLAVHLQRLHALAIDGLFFQDFGVLQICKEEQYPFDLVYAPDTLNTNGATLEMLHEQGISHAFLAREIPLVEKQAIASSLDFPCMIQIHGVEYMAYSKRTLLKNYFLMTKQDKETSIQDNITIQANGVEDGCHIYEDQYGTHILTKKQLCGLDILSSLTEFAYGYIESLYVSELQLVEVVHLYVQGLQAIKEGNFGKVVKEIVPLLHQLDPSIEYYHGFLFDQTVYKIADVRKREENERSK